MEPISQVSDSTTRDLMFVKKWYGMLQPRVLTLPKPQETSEECHRKPAFLLKADMPENGSDSQGISIHALDRT